MWEAGTVNNREGCNQVSAGLHIIMHAWCHVPFAPSVMKAIQPLDRCYVGDNWIFPGNYDNYSHCLPLLLSLGTEGGLRVYFFQKYYYSVDGRRQRD
jgi:hypothetical protein